jgi:hypothetical protein
MSLCFAIISHFLQKPPSARRLLYLKLSKGETLFARATGTVKKTSHGCDRHTLNFGDLQVASDGQEVIEPVLVGAEVVL